MAYQEVTKHELECLEALDDITNAPPSQWGAPCFFIPKKNKQVHLVREYSHANPYIVCSPHQAPCINTLMNQIVASKPKLKVFSALDIMMGYHTI
jgi:hypothetical protein